MVRFRLGRKADFSYWQCYQEPDGPIAQLDRVTDFYSVGCRFESCWDRQFSWSSADACGAQRKAASFARASWSVCAWRRPEDYAALKRAAISSVRRIESRMISASASNSSALAAHDSATRL